MKEKNRKLITIFNFYSINNSLKFKSRNENYCIIILKLNIMIACMILCFLKFNNPKDNINISIKLKNKGFLNITTIHKSKYNYYNYTDNILIYKDLDNNISYVPINQNNAIKESIKISKENYFQFCENKTLLDNTKYKRNNKPKISVIIPYYNKDKFSLYTPLRSIQNQSFKDIEIIFVDDGSSEKKINELIKEMKNDNRIILLKHKTRKGTLMSRVDGIRYSSGEYIIQLDQDDLFINNLLFEKIYKKAIELNADIVQFSTLFFTNKNRNFKLRVSVPKNISITQPELRMTFLKKINEKRFGACSTRMIWDKFVRRETYLEAIEDLGDEYLNHIFFKYEDTLMMFELSQVAISYYYYDIEGYRHNGYREAQSRVSQPNRKGILAMNQLYFIKLLLYKIDPLYDRYHIYKEWGFYGCGSDVKPLNRNEIDLLYEVLEVIFELERLYKNTSKELLTCANNIKRLFGIF
jgi:glycosyltransferase involved in cell wall biosynthesis